MSGVETNSLPPLFTYHELPNHVILKTNLIKNIMERRVPDAEDGLDPAIFSDEFMLLSNNHLHPSNWDCVDCPPPEFHLPPPPRPPWMDPPSYDSDCDDHQTRLRDFLSDLDTCDSGSTFIDANSHQSFFEDTFHSVAVIIVSAVVLVIFLLILGVFVFKKRKSLHPGSQCGGHSHIGEAGSRPNQGHHQLTLHKVGDQLRHHLSPPTLTSATMKPLQHCDMLVTAQPANHNTLATTQIIHARTVCGCGTNGSAGSNESRPNHYIPENMQPKMILVRSNDNINAGGSTSVISSTATLDPLSQRKRFDPPQSRNVMTLSQRPPINTPVLNSPTGYPPHILIGGQPFYLVPTSAAGGTQDQNGQIVDNYTYPQNIMPIYEEIDGHSRIYSGHPTSDFEYSYCDGTQPRPFMTSEPRSKSVHCPRTPKAKKDENRPNSSSTSNSQHTNSSEISSCNSSNGDHPAQTHHVLVNPFPEASMDVTLEEFKPHHDSFSSDYVNSSSESKPHNQTSSGISSSTSASYKYPPRLADGFERSRSPQSIYSTKLAFKAAHQRASPSANSCSSSGASSGASKGSSVYYYSDTLRRPQEPKYQNEPSVSSKVDGMKGMSSPKLLTTSDESDSGIGGNANNNFELSPLPSQKSVNSGPSPLRRSVNTRVVLEDQTTPSSKSALV